MKIYHKKAGFVYKNHNKLIDSFIDSEIKKYVTTKRGILNSLCIDIEKEKIKPMILENKNFINEQLKLHIEYENSIVSVILV